MFTDCHGNTHGPVHLTRAFPISAPNAGISVLSNQGHELAWIDSLDDASSEMRAFIEAALKQRDFMPVIQHILQVSSFATPSLWHVATDRGPTQFILKGEDQIWRLKNNQILITDKNGVNYLIHDITALDKHSRRLLDRFF